MYITTALAFDTGAKCCLETSLSNAQIHLPRLILPLLSIPSTSTAAPPPLPLLCLFLSPHLESLTEVWWLVTARHLPYAPPPSSRLVTVALGCLPLQHPRRAHAGSTVCLCSLLIRAKCIDRSREKGAVPAQAGR